MSKKKTITIAEALKKYADENSGAVGDKRFTELLKMFTKTNIVGQLKDYNKKFPEKSIVALILSETMSDKEDQREALVGEGGGKDKIMGIFTLLLERAKDLGVDAQTLATYKHDFTTELNKQLDKFMSSIRYDSTKLDNLMNALIQTIDNYQAGKAKPDSAVKLKGSGATASRTQMNAYNTAAKRLNKAQRDFNAQMKQDGWAGDVADAFGRIYGSQNVADKVRADLRTCKKQMNELNAALNQGDAAFRAKFKEIFGIPYNARNIQAYQDIEKTYLSAAKVKAQEDTFKEEFSLLLNNKPLAEEGQMVTQSLSAGTSTYVTTATKADVYKREFNKLAKLMGKNGVNQLNALVNGLAGTNPSLEKKYEALQKLAQSTFKNLQSATKKACGGRSFDSVQKQYDNSYKAAYGVENDILKRVTAYNISQQKGAGVVKGIGTALLTVAGTLVAIGSGGTLTPAIAATVTGVAAAAPAVVEVSDRATSGKALDSLRNDGVLAWLKTTNKETDWGSVAKTSLINGALSVVFMGQSYAVTGLCMKSGLGATVTGAANAAGIAATGLGTEYIMTGEISVEGAIFTVVMAVVGGVMTVKSIKAANTAESQARAEQHAADIQTSRQALGFEDGVEITPEGLKAQYKKLSLQNHPDRGGSAARMAEINNAYDFLTKNLADLNIAAPKVSTANAKTSVGSSPAKATAEPTATKSSQTTTTPKEFVRKLDRELIADLDKLTVTDSNGNTVPRFDRTEYFQLIKTYREYPKEFESLLKFTDVDKNGNTVPRFNRYEIENLAPTYHDYPTEVESLLKLTRINIDGNTIPRFRSGYIRGLAQLYHDYPTEVENILKQTVTKGGRTVPRFIDAETIGKLVQTYHDYPTEVENLLKFTMVDKNGNTVPRFEEGDIWWLARTYNEYPTAVEGLSKLTMVDKNGNTVPKYDTEEIIFKANSYPYIKEVFSAELEAMSLGDPENALWLKAYEQSPQATRWLCHNAERGIDTKAAQLLASWAIYEEEVEALACLVDMKSPHPVEHRNSSGAIDNFALDIEVIPELIEIEKQYPGVIQEMVKDPGITGFNLNSHSKLHGNYELPLMVEAYQKNPQLVKNIISTIQGNGLYKSLPIGMMCKLSIDNPDGVMNFIKDPRNYENIDWLKMFDNYSHDKDAINELASIVNLYNKNPENFHALKTVSRSRTGAPLTAQQTEDWINIFSKYHKLVKNKQGQVAYATMPNGNMKLNYDNNGILISTQNYNNHGQLTGISLFGTEGDNLVVTTLRAGNLALDGKAEIEYYNSNGKPITDYIHRPLTPEEIAMLRNMEPTNSYIAGVHNNLDAQLPDVSPLNLENFAKPFDNLPKDTKMLITQTNEGVVVTTDDNGHVIENRFAKITETNGICVNFYDKNNNLICTRVYDNAMSECHHEVIYEPGGVTKHIDYNYSDGTPEYRVVERRDNSKTQYNSDGRPKFEYTNENETRYDSDGRLIYKRYLDQNGIEHKIQWSKTLERYIFSE